MRLYRERYGCFRICLCFVLLLLYILELLLLRRNACDVWPSVISFGCFVISLLDFLFALELTYLLYTVHIQAAFLTDEIRRTPPTPQDEMRAGMSYFHETIWKGVPKFLRRVDTALKNIGINERVPYNAPLIQFSSWMGSDHDGMILFLKLVFIDGEI